MKTLFEELSGFAFEMVLFIILISISVMFYTTLVSGI